MAAKVDIFNEALGLLGAQAISDPEAAGVAAICNSVYETSRLSLLESHPWNFALKRSSLGQQVTTPEFEYAYQYSLPADCVRLLKFYNHSGNWAEENGIILSDSTEVNCLYVADITDVNLMTALFRKILAYDIAITIGYTITQNNSLIQSLVPRRHQLYVQAKMVDGQKTNSVSVAFRDTLRDSVEIEYGLRDD